MEKAEIEQTLSSYGDFLLKGSFVVPGKEIYFIIWLRRFFNDTYLLKDDNNVETTMIYTHVVKDMRNPAISPLDMLDQMTEKG